MSSCSTSACRGSTATKLARRLRERHPISLKLVALTGWGQEEDRRRSEEAGFDAHLVKPIDLAAALTNLLAETGAANPFLEVSLRNPGGTP